MKRLVQQLAPAILMMTWCTYYFVQVSQQKPESQLMIRPVYFVLCVLFALIVLNEIRKARAEGTAEKKKTAKDFKGMLIFVSGTAVYLFLMPIVGFVITTPIFLLMAFVYLKSSRKMAVVLAVLLTAFVYVAFKVLLGVPLPAGFLGI